jgi:hypothetical protein
VPDLRRGERLLQVVLRPAPQREHRGLDGRVGGDHHDRELGVRGEQLRNQVDSALLREPQVEERHVEARTLERGQRGDARGHGLDLAARLLEAERERRPDVLLVVDDEHADLRGARLGHGALRMRRASR